MSSTQQQQDVGQPGRIFQAAFLVRRAAYKVPLAHLSADAFCMGAQGVQWSITALSLLFVLFRLTIRRHTHRRFLLDDLVILAWMMHLESAMIWQVKAPALYRTFEVERQSWEVIASQITVFYRVLSPLNILYPLALWSIKLSLLVFFYGLGTRVGATGSGGSFA
ncbi:uncharacterized protein DSM5745_03723 [Aspergillus mulundensis]|uniref:Integral membrane protein n=1 Tax=Aspergillus mulundensis TaxID=1810919 RepID=A0A3D8SLM5_9EURO|nr:hypothetical protein DSM5745_03723 [Aspergillus mulundensis]RDW87081.1 hypothetical protein DSM5745_03723 [Aspergillus mulundensis]